MTRRRWIQIDGALHEVGADYAPEPRAPLIFGDLPDYQSPVTGRWVSGRVGRREDLKRTGSRPWEGLAEERKEAARVEADADRKLDAALERSVAESFYAMAPRKRDILRKMR